MLATQQNMQDNHRRAILVMSDGLDMISWRSARLIIHHCGALHGCFHQDIRLLPKPKDLAKRILVPALGRIRLAKLNAQQIEEMYTQQLTLGAAPASVRQLHAVLRHVLGDALRLGLIQRNVAALVRAPRVPRHEMQVLSPDEARALLAAAQGERLEALYVLAMTTGMRQGELLALRWHDVDLRAGALHVQATLRYENADRYYLDPPKTPKSRRHISLSTTAIEALRQHRARQLEERLVAGPVWREEDLVFCTPIGSALCGRVVTLGELPRLLNTR